MSKKLRRTVTVGILAIVALSVAVIYASPANATGAFTVDGMDGIVTVYDTHGNWMIVKAECARVIVDSGTPDLIEIHRDGTTATPEYLEACFD